MGKRINYQHQELIDYEDILIGIALLEHILVTLPHPKISYSALANKAKFQPGPRNLGGHLGNLSEFCRVNGLPLISAVVVNQSTYLPGRSFFTYFFNRVPEKDWDDIVRNEIRLIVRARYELQDLLNWMRGNR